MASSCTSYRRFHLKISIQLCNPTEKNKNRPNDPRRRPVHVDPDRHCWYRTHPRNLRTGGALDGETAIEAGPGWWCWRWCSRCWPTGGERSWSSYRKTKDRTRLGVVCWEGVMSRFPGVKVEVVVVEELAVTVMMMRLEQVDFGLLKKRNWKKYFNI